MDDFGTGFSSLSYLGSFRSTRSRSISRSFRVCRETGESGDRHGDRQPRHEFPHDDDGRRCRDARANEVPHRQGVHGGAGIFFFSRAVPGSEVLSLIGNLNARRRDSQLDHWITNSVEAADPRVTASVLILSLGVIWGWPEV